MIRLIFSEQMGLIRSHKQRNFFEVLTWISVDYILL